MNTHRHRKRSAAAALLTAALAVTGATATSSSAFAASEQGGFDYFAGAIEDLRTGSVFETVTYERFERLLQSDGRYALLIGGVEDESIQTSASTIDALAQQYGVEKIYAFDPRLDGNAVDIRTSEIEQFAALWSNLTTNYLNLDTNPEFTGANDPYLAVYDRNHTIEGAEDRIVASLAVESDPEAGDQAERIAAVFDAASEQGQRDLSTQSQFDFFRAAVNERHETQYGNPEAYGGEILGAAQGENFVLKSVTYPELLALLNTPGDHAILFGGTWCHNTRAVLRDVNDKASQAGVETVYVFDLKLDGSSNAPLHIRDSNSPYSYLYGELVAQYLPGLRTQFGFDRNTILYHPGGDTGVEKVAQQRLQVPYLIQHNPTADTPIVKDWIQDNGDGTFTEFMTEYWWVNDLPGARNANRYPSTAEGDAAWAAEQAKQWAFGDAALAELDVFFGLNTGGGDGDNGGEGDVDGDGSGGDNGGGDNGGGDNGGEGDAGGGDADNGGGDSGGEGDAGGEGSGDVAGNDGAGGDTDGSDGSGQLGAASTSPLAATGAGSASLAAFGALAVGLVLTGAGLILLRRRAV